MPVYWRDCMRIGLLGFGSMGRTHSYAVANLPYFYRDLPFSARIAGVCTKNPANAAEAAQKYGFPLAVQYEDELIHRDDIDVIDICTPNIYHYDTLKKALCAKKHVYCEKPLCVTEEQAQARAIKLQNGENGYTLMDTHNSLAFLGKNIDAETKKIAIDFLQFAYTDESLVEFSKITDTTKAVQYKMSDADKAQMSAFGRSIVAMQETSDLVYGFSKTPFYQLNEETFTDYKNMYASRYTANSTPVKVAFDEFRKGKTAKEYFDGLYTYQKVLWDSGAIVKN